MNSFNSSIFTFFVLVLLPGLVVGESVFTYRVSEGKEDTRRDYEMQLLELALNKTIDEYGEYTLAASPKITNKRAIRKLVSGELENFVMILSYSPDYPTQSMSHIPMPVDFGVLGYRVCFANENIIPRAGENR